MERFIAVYIFGALINEANRLRRYLYGSASVVNEAAIGGKYGAVVKVEADARNVDYLANYQAERLSSGLFYATVEDSFENAAANLWGLTGILLDKPGDNAVGSSHDDAAKPEPPT